MERNEGLLERSLLALTVEFARVEKQNAQIRAQIDALNQYFGLKTNPHLPA